MSDSMIFSQAGVFQLQQLSGLIYRRSGKRHKLSTEQDQLELLRAASASSHADVRLLCQRFAKELDARQLSDLKRRGVALELPQQAG